MNINQLTLKAIKGDPIIITHQTPNYFPDLISPTVKLEGKIKHSNYKFENSTIRSTRKFRSKYGQI